MTLGHLAIFQMEGIGYVFGGAVMGGFVAWLFVHGPPIVKRPGEGTIEGSFRVLLEGGAGLFELAAVGAGATLGALGGAMAYAIVK